MKNKICHYIQMCFFKGEASVYHDLISGLSRHLSEDQLCYSIEHGYSTLFWDIYTAVWFIHVPACYCRILRWRVLK